MLKAMKSVQCLRLGTLFTGLGLGLASMVSAEEVPTGYFTKANLASVNKQTFDGHSLGSMIPPSVRKMIELEPVL
jgi:phosphopentomutase